MADPLSIFGAVVGGSQAADKACQLISLVRRVANAPKAILHVQEELSAISVILKRLQPFILQDGSELSDAASFIQVQDLTLVATDLTKSMSKIHSILALLANEKGLKGSSVIKNSLWVKNEKTVKQELDRLQCQKCTLVAMLALFEGLDTCLVPLIDDFQH